MEGKIIKIISNNYYVKYDNQIYKCICSGKLKNLKINPVVGDNVLFDISKNFITSVLKRKNFLIRPKVSNVDQGFIITSLKSPDFSTNLLDKMLVILEFNKIKPIICLTKEDLLEEKERIELDTIINYYKKIGYLVIYNTDIKEIVALLKNKTTVFMGQTGSGKSTLLNNLSPELNLRTDDISIALGRGKHTTTTVELFELHGGNVFDTPGFSAIDFIDMKNEDIKMSFIEFNKYDCNYKDCSHVYEKDCMIKEMVLSGEILKSRYDNYLKFVRR